MCNSKPLGNIQLEHNEMMKDQCQALMGSDIDAPDASEISGGFVEDFVGDIIPNGNFYCKVWNVHFECFQSQ